MTKRSQRIEGATTSNPVEQSKQHRKPIPFLDIVEKRSWLKKAYPKEVIQALQEWSWKEDEPHVNKHIGLSIASAFYGIHLKNPEEIYRNAQHLARETNIVNITETSGFSELFQVSSGLTEEQILLTEMMVASRLIKKSTAELGKKPQEVDLFIVATSVPSHPCLEEKLAQAAGITNRTPKFLYVRACDSSGSALIDVINGKYNDILYKKTKHGRPATVTIFGFEDANRLSHKGGDPFSAQLFSSAASAMTFAYHPNSERTTFKLIAGKHSSIPVGSEALQVMKSYKQWPQKSNTFFAEHLIEPPDGQVILMDPKNTPVVFKTQGLKAVQDVLSLYAEKTGKQPHILPGATKKVIMHHPSATIFGHVVAGLAGRRSKIRKGDAGLGFHEEQFEWVITEGNSPSAVMPIALGRQMDTLTPRDLIMVLTYGAGGSFTCAFYRLSRGFR